MFSKTDGKGNEYNSTSNKLLAGFLLAVEKCHFIRFLS